MIGIDYPFLSDIIPNPPRIGPGRRSILRYHTRLRDKTTIQMKPFGSRTKGYAGAFKAWAPVSRILRSHNLSKDRSDYKPTETDGIKAQIMRAKNGLRLQGWRGPNTNYSIKQLKRQLHALEGRRK